MKTNKFTMTELLVVVAVISILATLMLPSLTNAREHALRVSCASGLSNIGKTLTQQYSSNNGMLPSYNWMYSESMKEVYICPKDDSPKVMDFYMGQERVWQEAQTSFGFNFGAIGKYVSRATSASDFVMSFDANDLAGPYSASSGHSNNGHGNNVGGYDPSNPGNGGHGGDPDADDIELHGLGPNWTTDVGGLDPNNIDNWYYQNLNFRHLGIANHLILDGSVIGVRYQMPIHKLLWNYESIYTPSTTTVTNGNGNGNGNGNNNGNGGNNNGNGNN